MTNEKDRSQTLFQRARDIFYEAKITRGPDDQFEISWIQEKLNEKVRD